MRASPRLSMLLSLIAVAPLAHADRIDTVAGGGPDGLPALESNLHRPTGLVVDSIGAVLIAAPIQERIFRVDPSGVMTVLAGSGIRGLGGDGGPASLASFYGLVGVALDPSGDVVTLETGDFDEMGNAGFLRVRRIDAVTGLVTSVAQVAGGAPEPTGSGPIPGGLALDGAGNIYISDFQRNRVYRIDAVTGVMSTYAGGGTVTADDVAATLYNLVEPHALAIGSGGDLFISRAFGGVVLRVEAATGLIRRVAGGGTTDADGIPARLATLPPRMG